jgi:gp32 DNA binding protein like
MGFADYKKKRATQNEAFNKKLEDLTSGPFQDDRFWQPTVDKAGNGAAIIRFLPAKDGEDIPFVRVFSHGFQGPGGWFIENCLTTDRINGKNEKCPVCESNSELWNSGIDDNIAIVRGTDNNPGRKRKLRYISNILVVKDKEHPENEGKVFLFSYGAKIFAKIEGAGKSDFEDVETINPFDMYEGANFLLKINKDKGYRNYDNSKFDKQTAVDKNEKKMEEIYNQLYSLNEFIADNKFKSYADLKTRLNKVLGQSAPQTEDPVAEARPAGKTKSAPRTSTRTKQEPEPPAEETDDPPFEVTDAGDSDLMQQFRDLAAD